MPQLRSAHPSPPSNFFRPENLTPHAAAIDNGSTERVMELAESTRLELQQRLGTELEQLTRRYAERMEQAKLLEELPPPVEGEHSSNNRNTTPTTLVQSLTREEREEMGRKKVRSDYFQRQAMLVVPRMELENAKTKGRTPITDMLLRMLLIAQEAAKVGLGWDDEKTNQVVRKRLRQVLDGAPPDESNHPMDSGFIHDLELVVPITAPVHVTMDYFAQLEHVDAKRTLARALEKYFSKLHGTTPLEKKNYTMEGRSENPMDWEMKDIFNEAAKGLKGALKKRLRKSEKLFPDRNCHVGADLYRLCWRKNISQARQFAGMHGKKKGKKSEQSDDDNENDNDNDDDGNVWKLEDVKHDEEEDYGVDIGGHDEANGEPIINFLLEAPFNMRETDVWRLVSVIGIRDPEIVARCVLCYLLLISPSRRSPSFPHLSLTDHVFFSSAFRFHCRDRAKAKRLEQRKETFIEDTAASAMAAAAESKRLMEAMGDEYCDPSTSRARIAAKRALQKQEHRDQVLQRRSEIKKEKKEAKRAARREEKKREKKRRRKEAEERAARVERGYGLAKGSQKQSSDGEEDHVEGASSGDDSTGTSVTPPPRKAKMSRRKKLRMLRVLNAERREAERKQLAKEFAAAHENSEGIEFKERAFRPSKAAIMMNQRNFYDDARLSTRRPGSRASVFEPSLEDTAYGKAKIKKGEMKRRGTEYVYRKPKGHLKGLARFNLTLVRPPTKEQKIMLRDRRQQEREIQKQTLNKSPIKSRLMKRPTSTDYTPIPLHTKAQMLLKDKRLKRQRFGSLRQLQRAVQSASDLRTMIVDIPTTADPNDERKNVWPGTSPIKKSAAPHRTLADMQEMASLDGEDNVENQGDLDVVMERGMAGMESLVLEDMEEMEGVDGFGGNLPNSVSGREEKMGETGEGGEGEGEFPEYYDNEGNAMYMGEDGVLYYEDDNEWYDSDDDETVQQLKDLERQYQRKILENSKGKTGKAFAKVPILPKGFIHGQVRMSRTAQTKHVAQEARMTKLDKKAKKFGKKRTKELEENIETLKNKKPKLPRWMETIIKLTKRRKKKVLTKKEMIAHLKGEKVVEVGGVKEEEKEEKEKYEVAAGAGAGEKETDDKKKEGEENEEKKEGEGEDGTEKEKEKEVGLVEDAKGVERVEPETKKKPADDDDDDSDWEDDETKELKELEERNRVEKEDKRKKVDMVAKEELKKFTRYVELCRGRYKVVQGEFPTHATNFQDVLTQWRVRNIAHRKYYGWDDPPPLPPPRKRERPLNFYALKRQQREEDRKKNGYNVTKDGYVMSDREIFERKRAERLANAPKSVLRKVWEFFI